MPCVSCPLLFYGLEGYACFTAHLTTSMDEWIHQSHLMSHVQLSKCPLFILIIENKGGPTHGFKNKESTLLNVSMNFLV